MLCLHIGNTLVRINLSEQTEISDLIGSDLPSEGKSSMCFEWHDGPLLAAMKSGMDFSTTGHGIFEIFWKSQSSSKDRGSKTKPALLI